VMKRLLMRRNTTPDQQRRRQMARQYTNEQLNNMTLDEAKNIIGQEIYDNSHLFERLEGVGKVRGNGHHIMQKMASLAQEMMVERWTEKEPA